MLRYDYDRQPDFLPVKAGGPVGDSWAVLPIVTDRDAGCGMRTDAGGQPVATMAAGVAG